MFSKLGKRIDFSIMDLRLARRSLESLRHSRELCPKAGAIRAVLDERLRLIQDFDNLPGMNIVDKQQIKQSFEDGRYNVGDFHTLVCVNEAFIFENKSRSFFENSTEMIHLYQTIFVNLICIERVE